MQELEKNIDTAVEEQGEKKIQWGKKIAVIAFFVALILMYVCVPSVHEWVNTVLVMFKTGNFADMRAFIGKYGKWAMLISSLLMIFQSLAAPLPAFFITLTNANLFGWWQGCILSFVSSMAGAAMCFYIARFLGRDFVEKVCTKGALLSIENFFEKHGKKCILVARLLPFISFDVVSYAAGLTAMDFWGFFLATGLGQLPACIVYSYVGGMLTGGAKLMFTGLLCLFALAIIVVIIKSIYTSNQKKKEEEAIAAGVEYEKPKFDKLKFASKVYNGAFIGMTLSMIAGLNAWLNMRINMGWVFLAFWIIATLVMCCIRKVEAGWKFTVSNVAVNLVIQIVAFGFKKMTITPASRLREAFMLPSTVSFGTLNIIMLIISVAGLLLIFYLNKKKAAAK
ncbi:MAG: TVP38/TMEM64 family protein [Clostridiales bacterium]|nr:TVP38/TMEM64 family protein [Candidatus Crickella merdequi]